VVCAWPAVALVGSQEMGDAWSPAPESGIKEDRTCLPDLGGASVVLASAYGLQVDSATARRVGRETQRRDRQEPSSYDEPLDRNVPIGAGDRRLPPRQDRVWCRLAQDRPGFVRVGPRA
jgi:hypothetical protein